MASGVAMPVSSSAGRLWRRLSRNSNVFGSWRRRNRTTSLQINSRIASWQSRSHARTTCMVTTTCLDMFIDWVMDKYSLTQSQSVRRNRTYFLMDLIVGHSWHLREIAWDVPYRNRKRCFKYNINRYYRFQEWRSRVKLTGNLRSHSFRRRRINNSQ